MHSADILTHDTLLHLCFAHLTAFATARAAQGCVGLVNSTLCNVATQTISLRQISMGVHNGTSCSVRPFSLSCEVTRICAPEGSYEHGGSSGLEQARHVLDGQGVDAVTHQLIRQLQVVLQVILHITHA